MLRKRSIDLWALILSANSAPIRRRGSESSFVPKILIFRARETPLNRRARFHLPTNDPFLSHALRFNGLSATRNAVRRRRNPSTTCSRSRSRDTLSLSSHSHTYSFNYLQIIVQTGSFSASVAKRASSCLCLSSASLVKSVIEGKKSKRVPR